MRVSAWWDNFVIDTTAGGLFDNQVDLLLIIIIFIVNITIIIITIMCVFQQERCGVGEGWAREGLTWIQYLRGAFGEQVDLFHAIITVTIIMTFIVAVIVTTVIIITIIIITRVPAFGSAIDTCRQPITC